MRIRWKGLLLRLILLELLAIEPIRFFAKSLYSIKKEAKRQLMSFVIKTLACLLFVHFTLLFGFGALAFYLNDLLDSSYQGFLLVAGGCMLSLPLAWMLSRLR